MRVPGVQGGRKRPWVRLGSSQAERVCWSWPARDRLQGPREAGRGPSWKYRGPLQLQQAALPSRGGGTDGGMAGSGRAGPQGHRVRSNCLCLQARGDLSRARETQSRQSPWGASVLALPCSPPAKGPLRNAEPLQVALTLGQESGTVSGPEKFFFCLYLLPPSSGRAP